MIILSEKVSQCDLYAANEILWIQCLATKFTGVPLGEDGEKGDRHKAINFVLEYFVKHRGDY
jgi:hypothetical protein